MFDVAPSRSPIHRPLVELRQHPLIADFRSLIPAATVTGGSFAHHLPSPSQVPASERPVIFEKSMRAATSACLKNLLVLSGLPEHEPPRQPEGTRGWPAGYVGSVSHKGTIVVAALTAVGRISSIGIDLETKDDTDLSTVPQLVARGESPPPVPALEQLSVLFSAKEAIFKAAFPLCRERFGFGDVVISWKSASSQCFNGSAHFRGIDLEVRCSMRTPGWIASVALV